MRDRESVHFRDFSPADLATQGVGDEAVGRNFDSRDVGRRLSRADALLQPFGTLWCPARAATAHRRLWNTEHLLPTQAATRQHHTCGRQRVTVEERSQILDQPERSVQPDACLSDCSSQLRRLGAAAGQERVGGKFGCWVSQRQLAALETAKHAGRGRDLGTTAVRSVWNCSLTHSDSCVSHTSP